MGRVYNNREAVVKPSGTVTGVRGLQMQCW